MSALTGDLPAGDYNPSMYELLKRIDDPAQLRALERKQLGQLADELRAAADRARAAARGRRCASAARTSRDCSRRPADRR